MPRCALRALGEPRSIAHQTGKSRLMRSNMISRRILLGALASASLAGCNTVVRQPVVAAVEDSSAWYAGSIPDEPYSIPLVDRRRLSPEAFGQLVAYQGNERAGTIV